MGRGKRIEQLRKLKAVKLGSTTDDKRRAFKIEKLTQTRRGLRSVEILDGESTKILFLKKLTLSMARVSELEIQTACRKKKVVSSCILNASATTPYATISPNNPVAENVPLCSDTATPCSSGIYSLMESPPGCSKVHSILRCNMPVNRWELSPNAVNCNYSCSPKSRICFDESSNSSLSVRSFEFSNCSSIISSPNEKLSKQSKSGFNSVDPSSPSLSPLSQCISCPVSLKSYEMNTSASSLLFSLPEDLEERRLYPTVLSENAPVSDDFDDSDIENASISSTELLRCVEMFAVTGPTDDLPSLQIMGIEALLNESESNDSRFTSGSEIEVQADLSNSVNNADIIVPELRESPFENTEVGGNGQPLDLRMIKALDLSFKNGPKDEEPRALDLRISNRNIQSEMERILKKTVAICEKDIEMKSPETPGDEDILVLTVDEDDALPTPSPLSN